MLKKNVYNYFPLMNFKYDSGLKNQRQKQMCVCTDARSMCIHTHLCKKKNELEDLLRWEHSLF